jgi:chitin synthase
MTLILWLYTLGLGFIGCDQTSEWSDNYYGQGMKVNWRKDVTIRGHIYDFGDISSKLSDYGIYLNPDWHSRDISNIFNRQSNCGQFTMPADNCIVLNSFPNSPPLMARNASCLDIAVIQEITPKGRVTFQWDDLKFGNLVVFDNRVINGSAYFLETSFLDDRSLKVLNDSIGLDSTVGFSRYSAGILSAKCLLERYQVGTVGSISPACTFRSILMALVVVIIWMVMFIKVLFAILFQCFFSKKLTKSKMYMRDEDLESAKSHDDLVLFLVTCYSENEKSLRSTLRSIAKTDYPKRKKLIFIVADGLITGSGNLKSTPDLLVDMLRADDSLPVKAKSYIAISEGSKQHNMAKVYAGTLMSSGIPTIIVVKCGTRAEKGDKKPGNRGKRDSQVLLMNLLYRCIFNDRMTPLDYDISYKIKHITKGLTVDKFSYVLMVDADTFLESDSLNHMVSAMRNDSSIMGLCGETKIANKVSSWVTMIQVSLAFSLTARFSNTIFPTILTKPLNQFLVA